MVLQRSDFKFARHFLYLHFQTQRIRPGHQSATGGQTNRKPSPGVNSAPPGAVRPKPPVQVVGDSAVKGIIGTAQQIDDPVLHNTFHPVFLLNSYRQKMPLLCGKSAGADPGCRGYRHSLFTPEADLTAFGQIPAVYCPGDGVIPSKRRPTCPNLDRRQGKSLAEAVISIAPGFRTGIRGSSSIRRIPLPLQPLL